MPGPDAPAVPDDGRLTWRWPGLLPLAMLAGIIGLHRVWAWELLPAPAVLVALALVAGAGAWRARREIRRAPVASVALAALSLAVALAPLLFPGEATLAERALRRLVPMLVGWALVLWLPGVGRETPWGGAPPRWLAAPSRGTLLLLVAGLVAGLLAWQGVQAGRWGALQDEALYLTQAGFMDRPRFGWPLTVQELAWFRPEFSLYRDGILTTQYPPGWPAVLALFDTVGLMRVAPPLLGALGAAMIYRIGVRLHSPFMGLVAAALYLSQAWVGAELVGFMPHVPTATALIAATWLVLEGEKKRDARQAAAWGLAGIALGAAVAMRPLTGIAIGGSIGLWMLARNATDVRSALRLFAPVAAGLTIPAVAVLYYNMMITGDPLVFGYKAVHGPLHDLGFGERGYRYFFGGTEPVVFSQMFDLPEAMRHLLGRLWDAALELLPLFIAVPLLWLALARGVRVRWLVVAAFLLLPFGHFFHFASRTRFYVELVPFVMLGVALLIAELARRDWRGLGLPVTGMVVGLAVLLASTQRVADDVGRRGVIASAQLLADEHARTGGPMIVFIEEEQPEAYLFRRLWQFNRDGFGSPILVARSQGPRDLEMAAKFPERRAYRGRRLAQGRAMALEPLSAAEAP